MPTLRFFVFSTHFTPPFAFLPFSVPPREGHAERRWRLDACEGTPYSRAMTGAQTPHRTNRPEQMPALRSLRTAGSPRPRSICANRSGEAPALRLPHIGQARPELTASSGRTASTGPGQKSHVERRKGERFPSPGNARRLTARWPCWSNAGHIERSQGQPGVRNERKAGSAQACESMRRPQAGHGLPIGVRRRHPSATGAPHAPREGAAKCEERSE